MFERIAQRANEPGLSWNDRFQVNRQKALAGAYLFALDMDAQWLLEFQRDPTARCLMIEWIPKLQRDPARLIEQLKVCLNQRPVHVEAKLKNMAEQGTQFSPWLEDPASAKLRSLIQLLGNYSSVAVKRSTGSDLWRSLLECMQSDPDPAIQASCQWCLAIHAPDLLRARSLEPSDNRLSDYRTAWYQAPNRHVMIRLQGPLEFVAGSDADDPYRDAGVSPDVINNTVSTWSEDHRHTKKIERSFAIAMHETSYGQMQNYKPNFHDTQNKSLAPQLDCPADRISWGDAARYCNWLSEQQGIPASEFCFVIEENTVKLAENYLHKKGFRLPTEAEWEIACRAGTTTRCFFGDAPELLDSYCWYSRNSEELSLIPVHSRKPNDLGLFHSLGNVLEWTMDRFTTQQPGHRMRPDDHEFYQENWPLVILKGGSIFNLPRDVRASEYFSFHRTIAKAILAFASLKRLSHESADIRTKDLETINIRRSPGCQAAGFVAYRCC